MTSELCRQSWQLPGPHTHIVVYTKSSLVEQTTPSFLELNDTASSVSGIVQLGHNAWNGSMDVQSPEP